MLNRKSGIKEKYKRDEFMRRSKIWGRTLQSGLQANLISTWHAKSLPVTTSISNTPPKGNLVSLILLSNTSLKPWATLPCSRVIICEFLPSTFSSPQIMGHIISLFIVLGKSWKKYLWNKDNLSAYELHWSHATKTWNLSEEMVVDLF